MPALSQFQWPSLARDLAVMLVPGSPITSLDAIYNTYHITDDELKKILAIPAFQEMFKESVGHFRAQGDRAGQIFRANMLSQALAEKLFSDAMKEALDAKDMLRLLELLMRAAGVLDQKNVPQVNTQVNVGVALPLPRGLHNKKLEHAIAVS